MRKCPDLSIEEMHNDENCVEIGKYNGRAIGFNFLLYIRVEAINEKSFCYRYNKRS